MKQDKIKDEKTLISRIYEELKNRVKLLEEQLTYQKTSWIKRIFKR